MAFNNIETFQPNLFLRICFHDAACFCPTCRSGKLRAITNRSQASLRRVMITEIPDDRRARCESVFEITKKQILYGKLYKDTCLAATRYQKFKCWAKKQPAYQDFVHGNSARKREFNRHCKLVNDAAFVYEHWEGIVNNLTDERLDSIDARTFSVAYFAKANQLSWCIEYNQKVRNKNPGRPNQQLYTRDDIQGIFRHIVNTGILDDADMGQAACIGQEIERLCVNYARRNLGV